MCVDMNSILLSPQASIGHSVSVHLSPNKRSIPTQANKLASTILHNLSTQQDDQCLLVYGSSRHKAAIYKSILGSLFAQAKSSLSDSLLRAVQLISLLTTNAQAFECLLATSVYIDTVIMEITGAHFSCMLLNTTSLEHFEVCFRKIHFISFVHTL